MNTYFCYFRRFKSRFNGSEFRALNFAHFSAKTIKTSTKMTAPNDLSLKATHNDKQVENLGAIETII